MVKAANKGLVAGGSAPRTPKEAALKLLRAIRSVVFKTPADKINMAVYPGERGCGCALYHAEKNGLLVNASSATDLRMTAAAFNRLFDTNCEADPSYKIQVGAPAKAEFLRRIDRIIKARGAQS